MPPLNTNINLCNLQCGSCWYQSGFILVCEIKGPVWSWESSWTKGRLTLSDLVFGVFVMKIFKFENRPKVKIISLRFLFWFFWICFLSFCVNFWFFCFFFFSVLAVDIDLYLFQVFMSASQEIAFCNDLDLVSLFWCFCSFSA